MEDVRRNDPCPCGSGKKYKKCCMGKNQLNVPTGKIPAIFCVIIIILLSLSFRYFGYSHPHGITFDEGLYADLIARQLSEDPTNYSTQEGYRYQVSQGQHVPEYLNRPLFKHPPLYNYLIALNYRIFGPGNLQAVSVSILFGSLTVLIVFLLGQKLYDHRTGLLAALFVCVDPVNWICSEKIWMETTMVFFMLLGVYWYLLGRERKVYLFLSGVSIGLAMLTKYPGILAFFIIATHSLFTERRLVKLNDLGIVGLTAVLVFLPWVFWNLQVYPDLIAAMITVHGQGRHIGKFFQDLNGHLPVIVAAAAAAAAFTVFRKKISDKLGSKARPAGLVLGAAAFACVPFLRSMLADSILWKDAAAFGWSNPFSWGPWDFYLTRLCELSPLYLFSFISFFLIFGKDRGDRLMIMASAWVLIAFILLGNYQTRYILPAVPFLLILTARFVILMYNRFSDEHQAGSALLKMALVLITVYFTAQTLRTDMLLALGPDFGYF